MIGYHKKKNPDLVIKIDSTIGKDSVINPLDLGLIVLCLTDTPISVMNHQNELHLIIRQVEDMVIVSEWITDMDIRKTLNETDLAMLEEVIQRYEGSLRTDVKNTGDICILLHNKTTV